MKIPDHKKMRTMLSKDVSKDMKDTYMSMSNEDIVYEYVKQFGSRVPLKELEVNELIKSELQAECNDFAQKLMSMQKNVHIEFSVFTLEEIENEIGDTSK
tara:strand:- start:3257 stop:3556 length:300 start_codon:yes stop_codon:yes gene_type:complete